MTQSIFSPALLTMARERQIKLAKAAKQAFVDSGGLAPPAQGAPGGDPNAAVAGADPGGAPAPAAGTGDPNAGGGGGTDSALMTTIQNMQQQINQLMSGGQGAGGAGGPAGQLKPKIDTNVEIMQLKHMMAKLIDHAGIPVSAQEMTATPEKLTQMAATQQTGDPNGMPGGGGAGAAGGGSAIQPIQPMQGASPGLASAGGATKQSQASHFYEQADRAASIGRIIREMGVPA